MTNTNSELAMNAAHHLDQHRFEDANGNPDRVEAILARHGEDSTARYADSDTLEEEGLDLERLGFAMTLGLEIAMFSDIIAEGSLSMDEINGMVENFIEAAEEAKAEPCPAQRAFARIEGCGFVQGGRCVTANALAARYPNAFWAGRTANFGTAD